MANNEIYESLFEMYEQEGFQLHLAADSFMEVLRLQFTPSEADKCLGCGVCFPTRPTESIHFERRPAAE